MSDNASHDRTADYTCERCRTPVLTHIPHEHDPSICPGCNGTGKMWKRGWVKCERCHGTRKTDYDWKPPEEDNPMTVPV